MSLLFCLSNCSDNLSTAILDNQGTNFFALTLCLCPRFEYLFHKIMPGGRQKKNLMKREFLSFIVDSSCFFGKCIPLFNEVLAFFFFLR